MLPEFQEAWLILVSVKQRIGRAASAFVSWSTGAGVESERAEELDCDAYAARYLIGQSHLFASGETQTFEKVQMKRQLGIMFGLLTIALLSQNPLKPTDTHPSALTRLREIIAKLDISPTSKVGAIVISACLGLEKASGIDGLVPYPSLLSSSA